MTNEDNENRVTYFIFALASMKFVMYRNWLRFEAYLFSPGLTILIFNIFSLYLNGPTSRIFLQVAIVPFWK